MFVKRYGIDHPDEIRKFPLEDMDLSEWNKYVDCITNPKLMSRAKVNMIYSSVHGTRSYGASRFDK